MADLREAGKIKRFDRGKLESYPFKKSVVGATDYGRGEGILFKFRYPGIHQENSNALPPICMIWIVFLIVH